MDREERTGMLFIVLPSNESSYQDLSTSSYQDLSTTDFSLPNSYFRVYTRENNLRTTGQLHYSPFVTTEIRNYNYQVYLFFQYFFS